MCEYCGRKEKDLARIDLEDDNNAFAYISIIENQMRLVVETDHWDEEVKIEAKYCPMCGIEINKDSEETPPYSHEDYLNAKKLGLELDNWKDYQEFYNLGVTSDD